MIERFNLGQRSTWLLYLHRNILPHAYTVALLIPRHWWIEDGAVVESIFDAYRLRERRCLAGLVARGDKLDLVVHLLSRFASAMSAARKRSDCPAPEG